MSRFANVPYPITATNNDNTRVPSVLLVVIRQQGKDPTASERLVLRRGLRRVAMTDLRRVRVGLSVPVVQLARSELVRVLGSFAVPGHLPIAANLGGVSCMHGS